MILCWSWALLGILGGIGEAWSSICSTFVFQLLNLNLKGVDLILLGLRELSWLSVLGGTNCCN
jgi:hypothetical protein